MVGEAPRVLAPETDVQVVALPEQPAVALEVGGKEDLREFPPDRAISPVRLLQQELDLLSCDDGLGLRSGGSLPARRTSFRSLINC